MGPENGTGKTGSRRLWGLAALLAIALAAGALAALLTSGILSGWPDEGPSGNAGSELPVTVEAPADEPGEELPVTVVTPGQPSCSEPPYPWNPDVAPEYVLVDGPSQVREANLPNGTYAQYGELDGLGRATGVVAELRHEQVVEASERGRQDISEVRPSGWGHNDYVDIAMPDGTTYHGYLWNRSHLLADSLGGEPSERNLVCGTRTQNVGSNHEDGGMAYCEDAARWWLWTHEEGSLIYAATPWYEGDELVPRAVLVDILSSDGEIDLHAVVYNAAAGYEIDYATGEFWEA